MKSEMFTRIAEFVALLSLFAFGYFMMVAL